jgi:hypothetical protein
MRIGGWVRCQHRRVWCIQVYKKRGGDQNEEGQGCCLGGEQVVVRVGRRPGELERALTLFLGVGDGW